MGFFIVICLATLISKQLFFSDHCEIWMPIAKHCSFLSSCCFKYEFLEVICFIICVNVPKKTKANLSAFTEKLIIGNMMTIYPRESSKQWGYPLVYRPSDWFHVGNREDITRMGSIFSDLQAMDHSALIKRHDAVYNTQNAICTESLWFKMVLNKYVNPNFDLDDWPDHLGMNALIDNFEVLNMITTARAINLNWTFQPQRLGCFIKEEEYLEEYKKLCE